MSGGGEEVSGSIWCGGRGMGRGMMPSKKFVNRWRSSAHLGRTAGAGLHGAGFGT